MQWRKRWHFKLNQRSLYDTPSIQLVLGGICTCGSSTRDMKSCFESRCSSWFEMRMDSGEWENQLSLHRCPPATATSVKSCFSVLNETAAWTDREQTQFVGSVSDRHSLPEDVPRGPAEPVSGTNSARRPKQKCTNLSIYPPTVEGLKIIRQRTVPWAAGPRVQMCTHRVINGSLCRVRAVSGKQTGLWK